jgi:hypothetical protein
MRRALAAGALALTLLLSCSGHTRYTFVVDALSFIDSADRAAAVLVPVAPGRLTLYILPSLQIDVLGEGPDERARRGLEISLPVQAPPEEVRLSVLCRGSITIENRSSQPLPGVTLELYLADREAQDIYGEGSVLLSVSHPAVAPGDRDVLELSAVVEQGHPLYATVTSGGFRLGVKAVLEGSTLGAATAGYTIAELMVQASGYPFGFIP